MYIDLGVEYENAMPLTENGLTVSLFGYSLWHGIAVRSRISDDADQLVYGGYGQVREVTCLVASIFGVSR